MIEHFPAIQVALPMIAAAVIVIVKHPLYCHLIATGVAWISAVIAWTMLQTVLTSGPISYQLGGWAPPTGIEYYIDPLNAFVLFLVSGIAAVVFPFAERSVAAEVDERKHHLFYACLLLCLTGMLGITITGDAFNIFVFLEITSLSSYALIAMGRDRRALSASFNYLVLGTLGGTAILIGVGLLLMQTGTLNIADLHMRLEGAHATSKTVLVALAFLTVGSSLKIALFPLHAWLPNAYAHAPSAVTALIAATSTKVSLYVLIRFIFTLFGTAVVFDVFQLQRVLLPLAVVGMFVGSLVAIYQTNIKRMLAYSSLAQIGYMVLGISLVNESGLAGSIVHMFNHAVIKGGLFMVMAAVVLRTGSAELSAMRGLAKRMPLTYLGFVIGGLGLIGVPLTAGFVSKWYLVLGAIENGMWVIVALILLSSLLAVIYVWRVVEVGFFEEPDPDAPEVTEAPLSMLIPTWIMLGASLFFGITTDTTAGVALEAARQLLGAP
ncbi:MAG: monovalent cation/H+ antiporter subunit D family protein [Myxococcota bacterium]|nr:monovalent cation/H+ antiporter subunit D family protein [Myxococcota bacterium]